MKKKTSLYLAILWLLIAGIWCVPLFLELSGGRMSPVQLALRALCVLCALAAAILHFRRYRKTRGEDAGQ